MKVIKRDGRAVEYNREKIEIAIEKANKEVQEKGKINKNEMIVIKLIIIIFLLQINIMLRIEKI